MLGSCGGQPDTARMAEHIPTDGVVAVIGTLSQVLVAHG